MDDTGSVGVPADDDARVVNATAAGVGGSGKDNGMELVCGGSAKARKWPGEASAIKSHTLALVIDTVDGSDLYPDARNSNIGELEPPIYKPVFQSGRIDVAS